MQNPNPRRSSRLAKKATAPSSSTQVPTTTTTVTPKPQPSSSSSSSSASHANPKPPTTPKPQPPPSSSSSSSSSAGQANPKPPSSSSSSSSSSAGQANPKPPSSSSSSSSSAGQANPKPPSSSSSSSSSAGQANPKPPSPSSSSSSSSSGSQYYVKVHPKPLTTPTPQRNPKNPPRKPRIKNPVAMEAKGKSFVWEEASIPTKPLILSSEPHDLCLIHRRLLETNVEPQDDVYAQMPSAMLERRRLNGKDKNHVVFTKINKAEEDGAGRIGGGRLSVRWAKSLCVGVFRLDGTKVGDHTSFTLVFTNKNGTRDGKWRMDLFTIQTLLLYARDSGVALLTCTDAAWDMLEATVHKAESKLREAYTMNQSIIESQRHLGVCITDLELFRRNFRVCDERSAGAGAGAGAVSSAVQTPTSGVQAASVVHSALDLSAVVARDRDKEDSTHDIRNKTLPNATLSDPSAP